MSSALRLRVVTAVILMVALIVISTWFTPFLFSLFMAAVVLMAAWEWSVFIGLNSRAAKLRYLATIASMMFALAFMLGVTPAAEQIDVLAVAGVLALGLLFWAMAFLMLRSFPDNKRALANASYVAFMGLCALLPTWVGVVQLKYLMPQGFLVLALIVMVAAVDVGAFFVGTFFGHSKLAPKLSPNKSWEGVWGGLATCFLLGLLLIWLLDRYLLSLNPIQLILLLLLSVCVTFFGVVGDLVESMLKRNSDVKDSGAILPGHGGILDRVDGLMAVTPVFVLTILFVFLGME